MRRFYFRGIRQKILLASFVLFAVACSTIRTSDANDKTWVAGTVRAGMPEIDPNSAIYELHVNEGVSYQDVIDSLKSLSEGMKFVNPANFPIGEHMKQRGVDPQGVKEVRSF